MGCHLPRQETSPKVRSRRATIQVQASVGLEVPVLGDDPERRLLRHADVEWLQAPRARVPRAHSSPSTTSKYVALFCAIAARRARAERSNRNRAGNGRTQGRGRALADVIASARGVPRRSRRASSAAETEIAAASDALVLHLGLAPGDSIESSSRSRLHARRTDGVWVDWRSRPRRDRTPRARGRAARSRSPGGRRGCRRRSSMRYGGGASETGARRRDRALGERSTAAFRGAGADLGFRRLAMATTRPCRGRAAAARCEAERDRIAIESRATRFSKSRRAGTRPHAVEPAGARGAADHEQRYERGLWIRRPISRRIPSGGGASGRDRARCSISIRPRRLRF